MTPPDHTPSDSGSRTGALKQLTAFALSTLLTTGGLFILRIIKNVVFTRLLGPAGRGLFGLLSTIPELVVSMGNMGFGLGSIYLISLERADLKKILGNAALYLLLNGVLLMIVGYGLLSYEGILKSDTEMSSEYRMVVAVAVWLVLAYHLGTDILTGIKEIHFMNGLRLLQSALPIVLILILWYLLDNTIWAALGAWLLTALCVAIAIGYRLLKLNPGRLEFSRQLLKKAFSFGLRGNVSMFANAVVRRIDVLFIAHYHGTEAVGLYAVGVSMAEILLAVPDAVALPFLPIRLEMDGDEAGSFSSLTIKYVLVFMLVACSATALLSPWLIVMLYGEPFRSSTIALLWLLPGIIALSLYQFLKADMYSLNRPGLISWISSLTMIGNLILNYLTIPAYGIAGAAASSSASYILSTTILMAFFLKSSGCKLSQLILIKKTELVSIGNQIRSSVLAFHRGKTDGN